MKQPIYLLLILLLAGACLVTISCIEEQTPKVVNNSPLPNNEPELWNPCDGLTCGDTCMICDPQDQDCVLPMGPTFYCDQALDCVGLAQPPECESAPPWNDCLNATCGNACSTCDPEDSECNPEQLPPHECTEDGLCLEGEAACAVEPDPCLEAMCGASCGEDLYCDTEGQCVAEANCPSLCNGRRCGSPCNNRFCDANGECQRLPPTDCPSACDGLQCGAVCDPCDEIPLQCIVPDVIYYCDINGNCQADPTTECRCEGRSCGDACACPQGETCISEFCNENGLCLPVAPVCPE